MDDARLRGSGARAEPSVRGYGLVDYQTMFWALEHSPEPREGMQAFMEKRSPNWVPDDA